MKKAFLRVLGIAAASVLAFASTACTSMVSNKINGTAAASAGGAGSTVGSAASTQAKSNGVKVALVLPGSANDKGWNQEAYEGLSEIQALGCQTAYAENVQASDYETTFRGYAQQGFNIVFGHGTEFEDAAKKVAPDFPNTVFCITSSNIVQEPNVCSLQNLNNEQGFMAGVVAALASKTKKVAVVGGMEIPSIQAYVSGFQQGVSYVNNGTTALSAYTGDFNDATKVKEQTNAFINQGADVITHNADEAGLGIFEAIKDAKQGIYAIGSVQDQYEEAPGRVLTSATNAIGKAMAVAVQDYLKDGNTLKAQCYKFGIKEGTIGLADYHDCANVLTDDQKKYVQDTMQKIASGEIKVQNVAGQG